LSGLDVRMMMTISLLTFALVFTYYGEHDCDALRQRDKTSKG